MDLGVPVPYTAIIPGPALSFCGLLGLLRMLGAGQHHPDRPDFIIGQVPDAGASAYLDLPLLKQLAAVGAKS